ncbi:oxidoreductase, partial [Pseudomonas aeruginosa]|nr:oxidoreductase [Pseudomonas aeruginosa]
DPNGSSGKGDSGAISVNAAPLIPGGKFRTIETQRIRGMEFEAQAAMIINMLTRYNVQHIGIDGSGIGEAVYQLVKKRFPAAVCYQFSPASKRM